MDPRGHNNIQWNIFAFGSVCQHVMIIVTY